MIELGRQLHWAWKLIDGYRWKIFGYMSFDMLTLALGLFFIYESKHAVDIATGVGIGSLRWSIGLIVSTVALGILTGQCSSWMSERIRIQMTISLQNTLVDSQMRTAWQHTKRWHTGDLLMRMNVDVAEVVQMLAITFPSLCVTAIRLVASWFFLWIMDPVLAWMILAISPLFIFSKLYYRRMRKLNRQAKEMESELGIVLQENLRQRLLIRALRLDKMRKEKYLAVQQEIKLRKNNLLRFSSFAQIVLKYTFNGGYLLTFVWGIYRLHSGLISFGTLTAFLQLVSRIQGPVLAIISFVPAAIRFRSALERLISMDENECELDEQPLQLTSLRCVELRAITFSYDDRKVLERLSATMHVGCPTAVVGATGCGKTTLIRLLLALLSQEEGALLMHTRHGEVPVSVATRVNFSYVPQGNTLFSGTIRENLLLAHPTVTEEGIREVLRIACAEFVYSFPAGIDTIVGESGYGLSEGQMQRIAIARALLHPSSVWLFDEATSALDKDTAVRLIHHLMEAGRNKILIFVTHDLRLVEACSQVLRLDE